MLLNYVWKKIQKEVFVFWKGKEDVIKPQKLKMYEDTRLCVMAYVIVMSECSDVFIAFKALSPFIDQHNIQDSIPMATVESAIQVILKDYLDFQNDEEVFLDN